MKQIEIPSQRWPQACSEFSLAHRGWLVTVATVPTDLLDAETEIPLNRWQPVQQEAPLQRLATKNGTGSRRILIVAGEGNAAREHWITTPVRIFRLQEGGTHRGMRIDVAGGESVVIWFRVPALPEMLDGLASTEM